MKASLKEQREHNKGCARLLLSFFTVFCVRAVVTPLFIKNERHTIPAEWSGGQPFTFIYRDVFVFGIRIIRYQTP